MRRRISAFVLMAVLGTSTFAAEYKGKNVDGEDHDCTAFSYDTGKYYYVTVEFDGDEAIVKFKNGGRLRLTLDDEEIDDPSSISAFDYKKGVFWDLDVPDLED